MDPIFTGRLDYISDANKVKEKRKRYAYIVTQSPQKSYNMCAEHWCLRARGQEKGHLQIMDSVMKNAFKKSIRKNYIHCLKAIFHFCSGASLYTHFLLLYTSNT